MKFENPECLSGPLPEWFLVYYPELKTLPELDTVSTAILEKLDQLNTSVRKIKAETLAAAELVTEETRAQLNLPEAIIWHDDMDRQQFTRELLRNFRIRVTMRDHELYLHSRTPEKTLVKSFSAHTREGSPSLRNQTWGGFYRDIDDALKATQTAIPEELIQASLYSKDQNKKQQAGQTIDRLLVPAFILLWQKGYDWYPDLTL